MNILGNLCYVIVLQFFERFLAQLRILSNSTLTFLVKRISLAYFKHFRKKFLKCFCYGITLQSSRRQHPLHAFHCLHKVLRR